MRLSVAIAVACLTATGLSAADQAKAAIRQPTNIEAQGLAPALHLFAKERDIQIVYRSELVGALKTGGAAGELTVEEALVQLLSGTGLTYEQLADEGITIVPVAAGGSTEAVSPPTRSFWDRFRVAQASSSPSQGEGTQRADEDAKVNAPSSQEDGGSRVEEIIVTATKRAENIQDVPISIAVVGADDISRRGLVNAEDYLRGIPGVNQVDSYQGQGVVIRGIETALRTQNSAAGTTVATYFGETPTTSSAGSSGGSNIDLKLVDIERVEVLRGPQGTAFGSSSMGGAVRTIPVAPKLDRFEGKVAAGYSSTSGTGGDNYNLQAIGNLPLIPDKLAIRATVYQYQDSGFYRNRAGSDAAFQVAVVNPYGAQAFAIDEEEVGDYYVLGGRVAALFQATDDLRFTLSYLSQKTERDSIAVANSGTYEQTLLQVAPENVIRGRTGGVADTDIDIVNTVMEYDLSWADLLATYSFIKSNWVQSSPFGSFGTNYPISYSGPGPHRENVGEIRLATKFDGAWNFLVGLYAEERKDEADYTYLWHGDPATNIFPAFSGQRLIGLFSSRAEVEQRAAFGEASWEFLPGFTLTGGVRAYEYDRTNGTDADGAFYGAAGIHQDLAAKASGENFRSNLSYKLDDYALFYASLSQGFRLGQPSAGLPAGACDVDNNGIVDGTSTTIASTKVVNSDNVDSYELGGKFALLDRRLMLAASVFRMEWSDVPVRVVPPLPPAGCGIGYVTNAGEAVSEGVELEANFQITNTIRVDVGGSWIHAQLAKDAPAVPAVKGNRLPGSAEVNVNLGLQYEFQIAGHEAFVRADSIYVGSFYGNLQESPTTKAGGYVKLDASARVAIRDLSIDLFVNNLTNDDAFTFHWDTATTAPFYGYRLRPRTIGLRLGYTF